MTEPTAPGPRRAAFAFVFVTVLLDMFAIGIIIPVLPKLVEDFMGGDTARAAIVYGVFGTAWALMQFLFSPMLGSLSDRFGRRPIILLSNFGLGLDYILMALAPSLRWLFVGRVISGITAASISTAGAYIADVTPPEERAAKFGLLGAAFGAGFVIGPALGGLLGGISPRLPFWVAAGLSLANGMYGLFVLPESLKREQRTPFSWRKANPVGALKLLRSHHELWGLTCVVFLSNLAHAALPSVAVLYMSYRYNWDTNMVGAAARGRRCVLDHRARLPGRPRGQGHRRAADDSRRPGLRRDRIHDPGDGAERRGVRRRRGRHVAVGIDGPGAAGLDDATRESFGTRTAAGREQQLARHLGADRSDAVHVHVLGFHRRASRLAPARCTVPALGDPARRLADRRAARDGNASAERAGGESLTAL